MEILLLFAFISGLVTIAAPCIWPLLPIILSASSKGGHRKPLGITLGIVVSFAVITLSISYIVKIFPFDPEILRYFAVGVIGFLGLTLLVPALSQRLESAVSRLSGKIGVFATPQNGIAKNRQGFGIGFITGFALGIVWTPCAGPILATIATLAATQSVNLNVILVTIVYVLGVGIPLFVFATAGSALLTKSRVLSKYTGHIQQVFGVVMILTALSIATNYDKVLQTKLLDTFPSYTGFLTQFEKNDSVKQQLDSLKGKSAEGLSPDDNSQIAPEFVGITKWLNTGKEGSSLSLKQLRGKVVLVDFWTYTCINCIRTLPYITKWYDKYKDDGFVVVGVHSPEFEFEKDTSNVLAAIKRYSIHYPVAQDNDFSTWNAYNNQYWPAHYLIDAKGVIRSTHFGEGEYEQTEMMIRKLLQETGRKIADTPGNVQEKAHQSQISPETYLGSERMQYIYPQQSIHNGNQNFSLDKSVPLNRFSLGGNWTISSEFSSVGKNAVLLYNFNAQHVYLVLKQGESVNGKVQVLLDGKIVDSTSSGIDVKEGIVTVSEDRLYELVDLKDKPGQHLLELRFLTPGVQAFAFTFG